MKFTIRQKSSVTVLPRKGLKGVFWSTGNVLYLHLGVVMRYRYIFIQLNL